MNRTYIIIAILIVALLGGGYIIYQQNINELPLGLEKDIETPSPEEGKTTISYNCSQGKTALEILKQRSDFVETEPSSYGEFVKSINNINQGSGKYWLYSIDGKEATVSASVYICQDDEYIKWELK